MNSDKKEIKRQLRRDELSALAINVIYIAIFGSSKGSLVGIMWLILLLASVAVIIYRQARRKGLFELSMANTDGNQVAGDGNKSPAGFYDYYKASSTGKKIGIAVMIFFIAFFGIGYVMMQIDTAQQEDGKVRYEQLSSATFKQIYSEEEPIRLRSKEIANAEYPLNPYTITGNDQSSNDYIAKHDACQAHKYREFKAKVLEKYNISESTYDKVVMYGASQFWDRNGNPPQ